jgi:hypothetical protein
LRRGIYNELPTWIDHVCGPIVSEQKLIGGFLSGFAIFPEVKKDFGEEISQNLGSYFEIQDGLKQKK